MAETSGQIEVSKISTSELGRDAATVKDHKGKLAATGTTSALHSAPRLHPVKVLHRHEDGYIAFALNEDDKGSRPAFGIKASALESMFPGFVDRLTTNAYVSINGRIHSGVRKPESSWPAAPPERHAEISLRSLCRH
jgi:hypothetical protein